LIKAVGDGRAGLTVHKECVELTDRLFEILIGAGRSFVFDSSMAYKGETFERINKAKRAGYFLTMIGVLTPIEVAVEFAMRRARLSRRFPHKDSFTKSHNAFLQVFREYFDSFDEIKVLANFGESRDIELVAEKKPGEKLEIANPDVFNSPPFMPIKA
jgi:predicted ABC-type ATPase